MSYYGYDQGNYSQAYNGQSYGSGAGGSGRNNANPSPFTSHHGVRPSDYGWTYQGCNPGAKAEFYQKEGVKMDYYPTTGTVKTSMDHPTQGKTQMFRKGLTDAEFGQVAQNPRQHTGKGYQTKGYK